MRWTRRSRHSMLHQQRPPPNRRFTRSLLDLFAGDIQPHQNFLIGDNKLRVVPEWPTKRFGELESQMTGIAAPRERPETIPYAIPSEDSGFVNNFMQATSNLGPEYNCSSGLLDDSETRIPNMISDCISTGRTHLADDRNLFAHILFMAQDGIAISYKINGPSKPMNGMVEAMSDLLLG
jgi:hypothetical protein